jgi:glycerophosphoryl diester phosphodiesterase
VREGLNSQNSAVRERAIRIVAWQGDVDALPALRVIQRRGKDAELVTWAIDKIEALHPTL